MAKSTKNNKYNDKKGRSKYGNQRFDDRGDSGSRSYHDDRKSEKVNGNHLEWYVASPDLLAGVANIPFNYRLGDNMPFFDGKTRIPGVMAIRFFPTVGVAKDARSPINVASNIIYANTRRANSGARNYDAVDQMQYFIAMDSIYMGITWLKRLYAIVSYYSARSRYVPSVLIEAMGVEYNDDLVGQLALMRARLNQIIHKVTTLAVPAVFPLFNRHNYMCSWIYQDEDSPLAQLYVFNPSHLYARVLDEEDGYKAILNPVPWVSKTAVRDWTFYMDTLEEMVDNVYADEDTGIITGDILKAYGSNIFTLSELPEYVNPPVVHDPEFMEQIHNLTLVGVMPDEVTATEDFSIKQVLSEDESGLSAYLTQDINIPLTSPLRQSFNNVILDIHHNPSPDWVMRATRLMVPMGGALSSTTVTLDAYGSEIPVSARIFTLKEDGTVQARPMSATVDMITTTNADAYDLVSGDYRSLTFGMGPLRYFKTADSNSWELVGSLCNTTTITGSNLKQLHQVAILGEFAVDRMSISKV